MCSSSLTVSSREKQSPLQQPPWPGTVSRFGTDWSLYSKPAVLVRSEIFLAVWHCTIASRRDGAEHANKTFFAMLDLSRTKAKWTPVTLWPSAWESRLFYCQKVCILAGKYLDTHRLLAQTVLPGANRDPPQAPVRGQYSLARFADSGEEDIFSVDSSIHFLNSTLSSHPCMGSTRRRNFHLEHAEVFLHSCFLPGITALPGILFPVIIYFDLLLFTT